MLKAVIHTIISAVVCLYCHPPQREGDIARVHWTKPHTQAYKAHPRRFL